MLQRKGLLTLGIALRAFADSLGFGCFVCLGSGFLEWACAYTPSGVADDGIYMYARALDTRSEIAVMVLLNLELMR